MKVSTNKDARNVSASVAPEMLGLERAPQSLFSLLLDIESRLRKEALNDAQAQIRLCNDISGIKDQKRSRVEKLSRYIE